MLLLRFASNHTFKFRSQVLFKSHAMRMCPYPDSSPRVSVSLPDTRHLDTSKVQIVYTEEIGMDLSRYSTL